ncbi:MAG: hypothetical protein JW759_03985 [Candidatus Coatesbacteria bacterium]|nr:hypothetical protein [Candidatus Coatesbacteria bacterium]
MVQIRFNGMIFFQKHHVLVKCHELAPVKEKDLRDQVSLNDNLVIHGDDQKALKILLPLCAGKVKSISLVR